MSDQSQGPGWWVASDGKWYSPERAVEAPPPQPAVDSVAQATPGPGATDGAQAQESSDRPEPPGLLSAPGTATEAKPSRGALPIVLGVAVLVIVAAVLSTVLGGDDDKQRVSGVAVLLDPDIGGSGIEDCYGTGGYDDFSEGVDVKVKNEDGKLIGSGKLENASAPELAKRMSLRPAEEGNSPAEIEDTLKDNDDIACVLIWDAEVEDAKFYSVEVGSRGELSYSKAQLEENGWFVSTTLGS